MELSLILFSRIAASPSLDQSQVTSNPLLKFDFLFIEQRRLASKSLTILVRDFEAVKYHEAMTTNSVQNAD